MSDVVVIGAGINGLLLSRELAAAGARVKLVEAGKVGKEASWAGGGIVSPLYPWRYKPAITALASWAQKFYPELVFQLSEETGMDVEYQQSGLLMLDAEDKDEALLWARSNNQSMEQVSSDRCYEQESGLAPGFAGGLWMREVGNIRNPRLCQALKRSLEINPAVEIIEDSPVCGLEIASENIKSIQVKSAEGMSRLQGDSFVVTAGAWSRQLLKTLNLELELAIEPVKGQMLLYKFEKPPINSILLFDGRYLIPRKDGHVLVGSTLEYLGFNKETTVDARTSLQDSASRILPEIKDRSPTGQWAGLRPGTKDGVPYIGAIEPYSNFFINAGQFRNGLVLAPASARLLSDIICQRQTIIDPTPYALSGRAG